MAKIAKSEQAFDPFPLVAFDEAMDGWKGWKFLSPLYFPLPSLFQEFLEANQKGREPKELFCAQLSSSFFKYDVYLSFFFSW